MCVPLVVFLSFIVLRSVSAGGVYCAKTARARAAALGLDYPGVHGAPDLYGPARHGAHTSTLRTHPGLAEAEAYVASSGRNQPGVRSLDVQPRSSATTFPLSHNNPVHREYTADQVLRSPRGQSVINRESDFEEVNRVAPPTLAEAPGQPDLVKWDPQGRTEPLSFVYNHRDLVVDESIPNRRGVSLRGLPLPRSRGHGAYQRGLAGYRPGREVPVLGSSGFTDKAHVRAMTGRAPAVSGLKRIRLPVHLAQPLHRRPNVRQFVQGNPVFRRMTKPKIRSS
ncbi:uncharacterized protein AB9X84_024304 [Acanthopagrus schlegelii]